jgi:hypothetical protein
VMKNEIKKKRHECKMISARVACYGTCPNSLKPSSRRYHDGKRHHDIE